MTNASLPPSSSTSKGAVDIYRLAFAGPVCSAFRAAFPQLKEMPAQVGEFGESGVGCEPSHFKGETGGELTVLEGPVVDPAQLAGIVSDICYRNIRIVRVELVGLGCED